MIKKQIAIILCLFFIIGVSWAGQGDKKRYKQNNRGGYDRVYEKGHPRNHQKNQRYNRYNKPHNNKYRGHRYKKHYRWHDWRSERRHRRYDRGVYHHDDNGYLMFSFCEQDRGDKVCFSISID